MYCKLPLAGLINELQQQLVSLITSRFTTPREEWIRLQFSRIGKKKLGGLFRDSENFTGWWMCKPRAGAVHLAGAYIFSLAHGLSVCVVFEEFREYCARAGFVIYILLVIRKMCSCCWVVERKKKKVEEVSDFTARLYIIPSGVIPRE